MAKPLRPEHAALTAAVLALVVLGALIAAILVAGPIRRILWVAYGGGPLVVVTGFVAYVVQDRRNRRAREDARLPRAQATVRTAGPKSP